MQEQKNQINSSQQGTENNQKQPLAFWRDPIWQSIAGIATVIGIFLTIYFFFIQRPIKELSYAQTSITQFVRSESNVEQDIEVFYKKKKVSRVSGLTLKFWNSGNVPIISSDYEKNVKFTVPKNCQILDANVVSEFPEKIGLKMSFNSNEVVLNRQLLNAGDEAIISFVIANCEPILTGSARITGVSMLKKSKIEKSGRSIISNTLFAAVILISILARFKDVRKSKYMRILISLLDIIMFIYFLMITLTLFLIPPVLEFFQNLL
jgi:hypothetical protein